jgi:two-component system sensor histidine kinase DesK
VIGVFAGAAEPAADGWASDERRRTLRLRRSVVAAGLLAGLYYVGHDIAIYSGGVGEIFALAALFPFGAAYLLAVMGFDWLKPQWFWASYAVLVALFVAELPFAHAEAFVMCQYIAMITAFRFEMRSWPAIALMTVASVVVPATVPTWHEGPTTGVTNATTVLIPLLALCVVGATRWQKSSRALAVANAEIARLEERTRISRDLHDILGHSLTTITVKAGLARRLATTDPARAAAEIGEVETLARRSLADVRATVSAYREVTLAGELAAGRELLRAAGITAELPGALDAVSSAHNELLGWTVREALTNVVRHAHATWCAVRVSPSGVEVLDDGAGLGAGIPTPLGNGLSGLRERVAGAGGTLEAGPVSPKGWRLSVLLPAEASGERSPAASPASNTAQARLPGWAGAKA